MVANWKEGYGAAGGAMEHRSLNNIVSVILFASYFFLQPPLIASAFFKILFTVLIIIPTTI